MAVIDFESFDATTSISFRWAFLASSGFSQPSTSFGRFGTRGISVQDISQIRRTFPAPVTNLFFGAAIDLSLSGSGTGKWMDFRDSAGTIQAVINYNGPSRTLLLYAGNAATLLITASVPIPAPTGSPGNFFELKYFVANSGGSAEMKLNGASIGTFSGDTQATANANIATHYIGGSTGSGVGPQTLYDDMYWLDDTGSAPTNTFLGDTRVSCLFPDGNGNSSQFVGSDADSTNNYLLVDETNPNDDTDYVESATVGNKDTYTYGNLPSATGAVYAVQPLMYAKKTDASARSIASVARVSATEVDSANKVLGTGYVYYPDVRETKPGGGAWTISDVNAAEFGPKITV
jgi:hypothetical protein